MPATVALPESMLRIPSIISRVVVLPAPFGPRMPNTSPLGDLETDAVDGLQRAVLLAQVAGDQHRPIAGGREGAVVGRSGVRGGLCHGRPMLADQRMRVW